MRMKRLLAALLAAVLLVSVWPIGFAAAEDGEGTQEAPFLIADEAALRSLAERVNNGETFEGQYFLQTEDICLTQTWTAIGSSANNYFGGNYDGGGHTISGLTLQEGVSNQGLFGYAKNGSICNLRVSTAAEGATVKGYSGILVGRPTNERIENVTTSGKLIANGSSYVGGIAGYVRGTQIISCRNEADIVGDSFGMGGIAGYLFTDVSSVSCCVNTGNLENTNEGTSRGYTMGGIVASIRVSGTTIDACANFGTLSGSAATVGGIVGTTDVTVSTISDCYNAGQISTTNTNGVAGGVVGYLGQPAVFQSCYNRGAVSAASAGGVLGWGVDGMATGFSACYYLQSAAAQAQGNSTALSGAAAFEQAEDYTALIEALGDSFCADVGINDGYPILRWQDTNVEFAVQFALSYDTQANLGEKATLLVDDEEYDVDGTIYLAPGSYRYSVTQKGYAPVRGSFTVGKQALTVPVELTALRYRHTVTVTPETAELVLYDADGQQIAPQSAENGSYEFSLYNGAYRYEAKCFGYEEGISLDAATGTVLVNYADGETQVALNKSSQYGVSFLVYPEGLDYVISIYSADPDFDGLLLGTYSQLDGVYFPVGDYTYKIQADGYVTQTGSFTVADGAVVLTLTLQEKPSGWDGSEYDIEWYEKNPDADSYELHLETELAGLAYLVNEQGLRFEGKTIRLCSDLDLSDHAWTPIGGYSADGVKCFSGTFDGQGHSITIENGSFSSNETSFGLFGYVKDATVCNLTMRGNVYGSYVGNPSFVLVYAGSFAGYAETSQFSCCANQMNIRIEAETAAAGTIDLGGIVGWSVGSSFDKCCNISRVQGVYSGQGGTAIAYVGGLVGFQQSSSSTLAATVSSCYNTGTVQAEADTDACAGGLIGKLSGSSDFRMRYCYAVGTALANGSASGALVGSGKTGIFTFCYYLDTLSSSFGTAKTSEELRAQAFLSELNEDFRWNENGYPLLDWEVPPVSISVAAAPTKLEYNDLEPFDDSGMRLLVSYGDRTEQIVSGWTIEDGDCLRAWQSTVTVEYHGLRTQIPITVNQIEHEIPNDALVFTISAPTVGEHPMSEPELTAEQKEMLSQATVEWTCAGQPFDGVFQANTYYRAKVTLQSVYETGNVYYVFPATARATVDTAYETLYRRRNAEGTVFSFTLTFLVSDTLTDKASHLYYEGDTSNPTNYGQYLTDTLTVSIDGQKTVYSLRELETQALDGGFGIEEVYSKQGAGDGTLANYRLTGLSLYALLQRSGLPANADDSTVVRIGSAEFTLGQLRVTGNSYNKNGDICASGLPYLLAYGMSGTPLTSIRGPLMLAAPMRAAYLQNDQYYVNNVSEITVETKPAKTFSVTFVGEALPEDVFVTILDAYGNTVCQGKPGSYLLNAGECYSYTVTAEGYAAQSGTVEREAEITVCLLRLWDGSYQEPETDAEGRYLIGTPEELAWFNRESTRVSTSRAVEMAQADVLLTADICMEGFDWYPIGATGLQNIISYTDHYYSGGAYTGCFDGQGHTISGLTIKRENLYTLEESWTGEPMAFSERADGIGGLMGYTAGAQIRNVGVEGSIYVTDRPANVLADYLQVGGLVGMAQSGTVIEGCYTDVKIVMTVGKESGVVQGYPQRGYPDVSDTCIGGIAGSVSGGSHIQNCYALGDISAEGTRTVNLGGIVGGSRMGENEISCCYAACNLNASPSSLADDQWVSSLGGIVGAIGVAGGPVPKVSYCFALNARIEGSGSVQAARVVGDSALFGDSGSYNFGLYGMQLIGVASPEETEASYRNAMGRSIVQERACTATAFTNVFWDAALWNFSLEAAYPIFAWQRICVEYLPQTDPTPDPDPDPDPDPEPVHLCQAFTDIDGHWAREDICFVVENGIFLGTSATTFSPQTAVSRGMLMTVLMRMDAWLGNETEGFTQSFSDVASGAWYEKGVAWATANGITNGVGGGKFSPNTDVTREQLAAFLYRYAACLGADTAVEAALNYTDAGTISAYAVPAVAWATERGLLTGLPDGSFAPKATATRAELAAILHRFAGYLEEMEVDR